MLPGPPAHLEDRLAYSPGGPGLVQGEEDLPMVWKDPVLRRRDLIESMPAEQLCRKPPCVAPRKCWQFDYCWFYGDPPADGLTTQDPSA